MYYYSPNPWYSRISNSNIDPSLENRYFNETEEEENETNNYAEQTFEISDIEGSSINGAITNNQVQVIINLAFDEIILFGGIPSLEGLQNSIPGIETEDGKFKFNIKEGTLILNGKKMELDKKVLDNGKKVFIFKTETQNVESNESTDSENK